VLTLIIFFPRKFTNGRLIAASTINSFLHRNADALVINPDIVWPAVGPENSIQTASHVLFLLMRAHGMNRALTTIATACSPTG
jgi:hypothetical protein